MSLARCCPTPNPEETQWSGSKMTTAGFSDLFLLEPEIRNVRTTRIPAEGSRGLID